MNISLKTGILYSTVHFFEHSPLGQNTPSNKVGLFDALLSEQ